MTGLFMKITNTMIKTCKRTILNLKYTRKGEKPRRGHVPNDEQLWEHSNYPPDELIPIMLSCLDLNKAYLHQY